MVNGFMKYQYFQPEVQVASIALQSNLLAGSPGGNNAPLYDIPTDDQW